MEKKIRVAVAGARGRMGSEVVKMVLNDDTLALVCGIDPKVVGEDVGSVLGGQELQVPFVSDVETAIREYQPDVLVDFTTPNTVKQNMLTAIAGGVSTSGWYHWIKPGRS